MELKEKELLELINSGERLVLKVFMDGCSFCVEYAPIFEEAAKNRPHIKFVSFNMPGNSGGSSEFKKKYMVANGKEKLAAPATFVFDKGEMKSRHFGKMSAQALAEFIESGKSPEVVDNKKEMARQELISLFSQKGEIITLYERLPELNKRILELQEFLNKG